MMASVTIFFVTIALFCAIVAESYALNVTSFTSTATNAPTAIECDDEQFDIDFIYSSGCSLTVDTSEQPKSCCDLLADLAVHECVDFLLNVLIAGYEVIIQHFLDSCNIEIGVGYVNEGECGNGMLETSEGCDDANVVGGDGCSADCRLENDFACDAAEPTVCSRCLVSCSALHRESCLVEDLGICGDCVSGWTEDADNSCYMPVYYVTVDSSIDNDVDASCTAEPLGLNLYESSNISVALDVYKNSATREGLDERCNLRAALTLSNSLPVTVVHVRIPSYTLTSDFVHTMSHVLVYSDISTAIDGNGIYRIFEADSGSFLLDGFHCLNVTCQYGCAVRAIVVADIRNSIFSNLGLGIASGGVYGDTDCSGSALWLLSQASLYNVTLRDSVVDGPSLGCGSTGKDTIVSLFSYASVDTVVLEDLQVGMRGAFSTSHGSVVNARNIVCRRVRTSAGACIAWSGSGVLAGLVAEDNIGNPASVLVIDGALSLFGVLIRNNMGGPAISNLGIMELKEGLIEHNINTLGGDGGGLLSREMFAISDVVFSANSAPEGRGGALYVGAVSSINGCTFVNNTAWYGAGMFISGRSAVENCYFEDNKALGLETGHAVVSARSFIVRDSYMAPDPSTEVFYTCSDYLAHTESHTPCGVNAACVDWDNNAEGLVVRGVHCSCPIDFPYGDPRTYCYKIPVMQLQPATPLSLYVEKNERVNSTDTRLFVIDGTGYLVWITSTHGSKPVTSTNPPWLTVSPASGEVIMGADGSLLIENINLGCSAVGMKEGEYDGEVNVTYTSSDPEFGNQRTSTVSQAVTCHIKTSPSAAFTYIGSGIPAGSSVLGLEMVYFSVMTHDVENLTLDHGGDILRGYYYQYDKEWGCDQATSDAVLRGTAVADHFDGTYDIHFEAPLYRFCFGVKVGDMDEWIKDTPIYFDVDCPDGYETSSTGFSCVLSSSDEKLSDKMIVFIVILAFAACPLILCLLKRKVKHLQHLVDQFLREATIVIVGAIAELADVLSDVAAYYKIQADPDMEQFRLPYTITLGVSVLCSILSLSAAIYAMVGLFQSSAPAPSPALQSEPHGLLSRSAKVQPECETTSATAGGGGAGSIPTNLKLSNSSKSRLSSLKVGIGIRSLAVNESTSAEELDYALNHTRRVMFRCSGKVLVLLFEDIPFLVLNLLVLNHQVSLMEDNDQQIDSSTFMFVLVSLMLTCVMVGVKATAPLEFNRVRHLREKVLDILATRRQIAKPDSDVNGSPWMIGSYENSPPSVEEDESNVFEGETIRVKPVLKKGTSARSHEYTPPSEHAAFSVQGKVGNNLKGTPYRVPERDSLHPSLDQQRAESLSGKMQTLPTRTPPAITEVDPGTGSIDGHEGDGARLLAKRALFPANKKKELPALKHRPM
eukprot:Rmarinus@m.23225